MFKCGRGCTACPYIREGKSIKVNDKSWKINRKFDCNTFNVIYAITCKKKKTRAMRHIQEKQEGYSSLEQQNIVDTFETNIQTKPLDSISIYQAIHWQILLLQFQNKVKETTTPTENRGRNTTLTDSIPSIKGSIDRRDKSEAGEAIVFCNN